MSTIRFNKQDEPTTPPTGKAYLWYNDPSNTLKYKIESGDVFELVGSPLTTKGDVYVYSTFSTRLGVGTDGQVLTASSGQATGLIWATPTTGTVTSVSGTSNRITSTGGATPVIDISASYVGQASITTLGTIVTGVWNGTTIAIANGGTAGTTANAAFNNLSPLTTKGDLIGFSTVNARLAVGTDGQVLVSDAASTLGIKWTTPAAGVSGANPTASVGLTAVNGSAATFLRSDGAPPLDQSIAPTWTGKHIFAITARTSGSASYFAIQTPADTTLAASTEAIGMQFGGDGSLATVTRQFATGALAMQRSSIFVAPTYAFVGASTVSVASTVAITGAPIAGTNATITFPYSLLVTGAIGATPVTGTNTVGNNLTIITGLGTGTAASGNFSLQVSPSAATGVSGSAYTTPIEMFKIAGSNGVITIGDVNNVYANGTINVYHGSGFSSQGLELRNTGAATAGNAGISIISSGTSVAQIINSGCYLHLNGARPALGINGVGGTNIITISGLTSSPSVGLLGYAAASNTAAPSPVILWREISSAAATPIFQVRTLADTALTASAEAVGNAFGGNGSYATVTRQWATGALTTQRENIFVAPTYGFVGASTITTAATLAIVAAPIAGTNATITNAYALWVQAGLTQLDGGLTLADATNIAFGTSTGTKIGATTSQKFGFWNTAPIVQPTTGIAASTFVANTSGTVNDSATWDGYTIGQVVKALRNVGLLA